MINISVTAKSGFNFTVCCDSFDVSDDFIHFTLDNYTICSVSSFDVKYFYSYEYHIVDDDYIKSKVMLFENGIILKSI